MGPLVWGSGTRGGDTGRVLHHTKHTVLGITANTPQHVGMGAHLMLIVALTVGVQCSVLPVLRRQEKHQSDSEPHTLWAEAGGPRGVVRLRRLNSFGPEPTSTSRGLWTAKVRLQS